MAFSAGGGGGDEYDRPMAEINVVPLVDVMLVLLIITMITSPFMETGVDVQLPVAGGASLRKDVSEDPITLFVGKDRVIRLRDKPVARKELPAKLAEIYKGRQQREIFVRADKDVPYGSVAEIMALVQAAGIEKVGLVTQPE
jgi:biopolymer transport protein TolR